MKREEQRILAGSLNVLPPSDKTPENDAIELINFRVDQEGVLRGGPSLKTLSSAFGGAPIHTIWLVPKDSFNQYQYSSALVGAGTKLYAVTWPVNGEYTVTLQDSGYDGNPLGIVVWNGYIWVMNQAQQRVVGNIGSVNSGFLPAPWLPAVPTAAPSVAAVSGGDLDGTYQYYVTFVAYTGLETNPGPASTAVAIGSGDAAQLTSIPVSAEANVQKRRIYRSGGTLGATYQVAEIADNTTTSYTDTQSDVAITETGIEMPGSDASIGDNSAPPAARGVVGPYFNYLLAFGGNQDDSLGNRLWWSQNGVPVFPGAVTTLFAGPGLPYTGSSPEGNWVDVGAPDDQILAITLHGRTAVIYKQRSIWRLVGDPVTGVLEQCSASIGALGQNAVAWAGAVDYVLSTDGVFLFDLDAEHKASEKIEPVFFGLPDWIQFGAADIAGHPWNPTNPVCRWLNGTLLVGDGSGTTFLLHVATGRWAAYAPAAAAVTAIAQLGSAFDYYAGDAAGNFSQNSLSGTTASLISVWQTRFLDQGLGDQPKRYLNFVLDAELQGGTAKVYLFYDNGAAGGTKAAALAGTFTGTARKKFEIDYAELEEGGIVGTNVSVRVEITSSTGSSIPPAIHGLYVYYEPLPRSSSASATAGFALDAERGVWQVKEIEYDVEPLVAGAGGSLTSKLLTDLPGNELALRQTDTVASSGWRRNYLLPQNTAGTGWWTGRLFQLLLTMPAANGQFRLWGARMLARKVGTYIEDYEATSGYRWDSWWLNFGSVHVKVFDQIKLEVETGATITVTVSTELPGETPAVVTTKNFTGDGARKWFTVELPADTIGRGIRVRISANGSWTFYAGMVSARVVGRYLSAAQGDQFRTLEQDFGSERIKEAKKLEIDVAGVAAFAVWTDEPDGLASRVTKTIDTGGARKTVRVNLPPNVRGRLWRIDATTTGVARIYAIRAWMRVTGEAQPGGWAWQSFALEPSGTLPAWSPLPVVPTSEEWTWLPVPLG